MVWNLIPSSVARGGCRPPIGLKSMQNSMFFVLLRPIFAPKMKTAPPPTGLVSRSCEGLAVIWNRIVEFFCSGAHPKFVKTLFIFLLFFFRSPNFGRKNRLNFGEDLFFLRSPGFDRKTASVYFKTVENSGQVRLLLFPASKKAPPFAKSWLRACSYHLTSRAVPLFPSIEIQLDIDFNFAV